MSRHLAREIIEVAQRMNALGLNQGTSGNVSARWRDGLVITPSGIPYDALVPSMIVKMQLDGTYEGTLAPSSEWRFHTAILANRKEVDAVLHAHSPFATALACVGQGIPAFHYMVAVAGGDSIRCAGYATFGTAELSDRALTALERRKACLLANHGMIVLGATPGEALALAVEVETLAEQYWRARQIGEPKLLSGAEMERVLNKFQSYGSQTKNVALR